MTLNSALEDLRASTLKAVSGSLRRLEYVSGLRNNQEGTYTHWGLARVHGEFSAANALHQQHRLVLSSILSKPLQQLLADAEACSQAVGMTTVSYLERLAQEQDLLPPDAGAGSARHFSSVLHALSSLARVPRDATPPAS